MSGIRTVLITALLAFSVINILSVNIINPSVHDPELNKMYKVAAQMRAGKSSNKGEDFVAVTPKDHLGNEMNRSPEKNVYQMTTILDRLLYHFPYNEKEKVENNIFQLWTTSDIEDESFPQECVPLVERWKTANKNYEHFLLSIEDAEDTVADILRPSVPEVIDALRQLPNRRLKYEFLKYLLIFLHGGVYADIDTTNVKPIKYWYKLDSVHTKVWLGVDADSNTETWMDSYNRRISFNNNIFRAKAFHPFLARVIARISFIIFTQKDTIDSIDWDSEYSNVDASGAPLIQFTGTSLLTDTAFEYLNLLDKYIYFTSSQDSNKKENRLKLKKQIHGPAVDPVQRFSYKSFTLLSNPIQIYDLVVLPKISFNGYDSAKVDFFDDKDEKTGYDKYYYGRSKALTEWSPKKLRLASTD